MEMSRAIESRAIYILGLLSVMFTIITNKDTLVILFGDVPVELINLIKISFTLLLFYCIFEIIAYSQDLFGEGVAQTGRFISQSFLTISLLFAGIFLMQVSYAIYEDRLTKFLISFFITTILTYIPKFQNFWGIITRDSLRETIKSQWNYLNFVNLMATLSLVTALMLFLVYDEYIDHVWLISLLCILVSTAVRIQEWTRQF